MIGRTNAQADSERTPIAKVSVRADTRSGPNSGTNTIPLRKQEGKYVIPLLDFINAVFYGFDEIYSSMQQESQSILSAYNRLYGELEDGMLHSEYRAMDEAIKAETGSDSNFIIQIEVSEG